VGDTKEPRSKRVGVAPFEALQVLDDSEKDVGDDIFCVLRIVHPMGDVRVYPRKVVIIERRKRPWIRARPPYTLTFLVRRHHDIVPPRLDFPLVCESSLPIITQKPLEYCTSGRWLREQHGYLSLPLMVRPYTVLPVGANENRPDYEYSDGVTFHVFELADASSAENAPASASVPAPDGSVAMTVEVRREGDRIDVQIQGESPTGGRQPWSVLLRGVSDGTSAGVASVEGGAAQAEALDTRLVPVEDVRRWVVHL
jgi:hypothetical protein